MITLTIAKTAGEWRDAVLERDNYQCQAVRHAERCTSFGGYAFLEAHHCVFKSHLAERSYWVVENGLTLSSACHREAHATHNANLDLSRINHAVDAVNCLETIKVKKFRRGKAA